MENKSPQDQNDFIKALDNLQKEFAEAKKPLQDFLEKHSSKIMGINVCCFNSHWSILSCNFIGERIIEPISQSVDEKH